MRQEFTKYVRKEFDALLARELPSFAPFHLEVAPQGFHAHIWRCAPDLSWFVNLVIGRSNVFGVDLYWSTKDVLQWVVEPRHPSRCPPDGDFAVPLMLFDVPREEILNRGMWEIDTPTEDASFLPVFPNVEVCRERLFSAWEDAMLRLHKYGVPLMVEVTESLGHHPDWSSVFFGECLDAYRGKMYRESDWFNGQPKVLKP